MKDKYSYGRYTLKQQEGNDTVYNVIDTQTNLVIGAFFAGMGNYRFHDRDSSIYLSGMAELEIAGRRCYEDYESKNS